MKKQFQILTATLITLAFVSCSKEKMEMPETITTGNEEISTSSSSNRPYVDPLTIGLEGRFTFDKHLKDVSKQLPDGKQWPASRFGVSYTTDRKGITNAALKLDGNYYVYLTDVPQQIETSMSVWVKRSLNDVYEEIITPNGRGPALVQSNEKFRGYVFTSGVTPYVASEDLNDQSWHHIVVTYDGTFVKLYVDGNLQGTSNYPQPFVDDLVYYRIGLTSYLHYWKGVIDDLRFYSRTLSAVDVQKLYNL